MRAHIESVESNSLEAPEDPEPCPKCYDAESGQNLGSYMYDENHGTICDLCCPHDQGWWYLTEGYANAGNYCCRGGCGHTISPAEYLSSQGVDPAELTRRGRRGALAEDG